MKLSLSELMEELQERIINRRGDVELTQESLRGIQCGIIEGELLGKNRTDVTVESVEGQLREQIEEDVKKKERLRSEKFE